MTAPRPRSRQPKHLDAGTFRAEISSFRLRLAAEGKAAKTIRTYAEAVQWFAAYLLEQAGRASWEQVDCQDIQLWMAWLLDRVQQRLRQQPVPRPAAVLQVAGRRRRAAQPDGRAAAAARHRQAGPSLHRR